MARLNANDSDEVKLEKLRLSSEIRRIELEEFRIVEAHKTLKVFWCGFFATMIVGIIAWAMVRMTDKPAWLELGLAIIGLFSGQTLLLIWTGIRIKKRSTLNEMRPREGPDKPARRNGEG